MSTILELAQHTDLPAETVLRVILREPTSESAKRAVAEAVAELGPPDYPRPNGRVEVLPDDRAPQTDQSDDSVQPDQPESMDLALPAPAPALALDDAVLAELRSLVEPASEQMLQLRTLFQELVRRLGAERRERVEDLELMTELMIEGWKNVDRRLGRVEKVLGRLEEAQATAPSGGRAHTVVRLEDWVRQPFGQAGSDQQP